MELLSPALPGARRCAAAAGGVGCGPCRGGFHLPQQEEGTEGCTAGAESCLGTPLSERGEGTCLPGARASRSHPMSIPQPPRWMQCPPGGDARTLRGPPQLSQLQVAGNERNPSSLELNPFLICNLFHKDKPKLPYQYVRSILSAWRDAGHGCAALFLR